MYITQLLMFIYDLCNLLLLKGATHESKLLTNGRVWCIQGILDRLTPDLQKFEAAVCLNTAVKVVT